MTNKIAKPIDKICMYCGNYGFKPRPVGLHVHCFHFKTWFPFVTSAEIKAENKKRAAAGRKLINPDPPGYRTCKHWKRKSFPEKGDDQ